jgi:hypothetical protein
MVNAFWYLATLNNDIVLLVPLLPGSCYAGKQQHFDVSTKVKT